ncbi:hypothetical protein GW17_00029523 [Ensete ventricosum]|nr:hypothetical protein GW17_00029523 [Ensete ventricosum]
MGFKEARASNDQATTTKELTHAAKQQLTGRETADARRQATTLRGCRQAITYSASVPITSRVTTSRATYVSWPLAGRYTLSRSTLWVAFIWQARLAACRRAATLFLLCYAVVVRHLGVGASGKGVVSSSSVSVPSYPL